MGQPTRYGRVSPWSSAQRPRKSALRTIGGQKERSAGESESDEGASSTDASAVVDDAKKPEEAKEEEEKPAGD